MSEISSLGNLNFTKINKALMTSINKINDSTQEIDLIKYITTFQFTTTLTNPTIFGTLVINDYDGIMNDGKLVITGEEFVYIEITTIEDITFKYKFVIASIDLEIKDESGSDAILIISLISVDSFSNTFGFKSKGYVNLNITDIVKGVLQNELLSEIPIDNFEDTKGKRTFGFTKIRPFEKIEILTQQAYSDKDYLFSKFFFYESRNGYNFRSFEDIIIKSNANTTPLLYQYSEMAAIKKIDDPLFRNIKSYQTTTRSNNFDRIINGFYGSDVYRFDFNTKRITTEYFNAYEDIKKISHVGTNSKELNGLTLNVSENFAQAVAKAGRYTYLLPWNSENIANDLTYKYYQYTKPLNLLLKENTLNIVIDGTLLFDLGDPLEVEITNNYHPNSDQSEKDMRYSGRYIVQAISHIISQRGQYGLWYHDCSVSLVRDLIPIPQDEYNEKQFGGYDINTLSSNSAIPSIPSNPVISTRAFIS